MNREPANAWPWDKHWNDQPWKREMNDSLTNIATEKAKLGKLRSEAKQSRLSDNIIHQERHIMELEIKFSKQYTTIH